MIWQRLLSNLYSSEETKASEETKGKGQVPADHDPLEDSRHGSDAERLASIYKGMDCEEDYHRLHAMRAKIIEAAKEVSSAIEDSKVYKEQAPKEPTQDDLDTAERIRAELIAEMDRKYEELKKGGRAHRTVPQRTPYNGEFVPDDIRKKTA
jgi:hypothetical protein